MTSHGNGATPDGLKRVPNYPDYGVTADGLVWSSVMGRGVRSKEPWRVLKQTLDTRGFPKVKLSHGHTFSVHRLIAEMFLPPFPDGMQVAPIDGNRSNTAASNLKYVTESEENRRRYSTSGWPRRRKRLAAMGRDDWGPSGSYPTEAA